MQNFGLPLFWVGIFLSILCWSCQHDSPDAAPSSKSSKEIFESISPDDSGIHFENSLTINDSMNYFSYGYFYMGGGVAVGDLNGDTLPDLFFTSNMNSNQLYLNKGNLKFEDISKNAGLNDSQKWHTGCSFGDLNNDGRLDILIAVGGKWKDRKNLVYLNKGNDQNGNPIFEEAAEKMGIADKGNTIQTTLFDYDKDGDLDLYVLNYPITKLDIKTPQYINLVENPKWETSDHLYRNNGNNTFTDVTAEAGLIAFGLGIGVITSDLNQDGWPDIYVSNDFQTPDFYYANNGDGTFTESLNESFQHTSFFGMGVDVGDVNNDALPDLFQVDMTTNDNYRSKANMASMDIPGFQMMVNSDLGYQYMYNSLQINNGLNKQGVPYFSNTAMSNDLASTEWSWACLFADFDLDGLSDLFISNGTRKDINNKDYFKWLKQTDTRLKIKYKELSVIDLVNKMPEKKAENYLFKNNGDQFEKANDNWNINHSGFSNGAVYADLDNDGDLEIIINNIDSTAAVFNNLSSNYNHHFLKVTLKGSDQNRYGIGAKIYIYCPDFNLYKEQILVRGYQSSIDPVLHFGLKNITKIDSIKVVWPDDKVSLLQDIPTDQTISIDYSKATTVPHSAIANNTIFSLQEKDFLNFSHQENQFNDYDREILIPHKMSSFGPALAVGDIDKNGFEDIFLGGAKGQSSQLFLNQNEKGFTKINLSHPEQEDNQALFFDINSDGHLDLLIGSGGNEKDNLSDNYYKQRYYLNTGRGNFETAQFIESPLYLSTSIVVPIKNKNNSITQFFYGGRQVPGKYPLPADSYIVNIENGKLVSVNSSSFKKIGMVTDAVAFDKDGDGDQDLLVVGEWMGIHLFENKDGVFENATDDSLIQQIGWWQSIESGDFDTDGDIDFVISNIGENYKHSASEENTFDIYANDFDDDKDLDIVLSYYQEEVQFPARGKQCSSEQMPTLNVKYPNYHSFASSNLKQVYGEEKLNESLHYKANIFQHVFLENQNGNLKMKPLPKIFQHYSINCMKSKDLNGDGFLDMIMAGNIFDTEAETPRLDNCYGIVALNDGKGNFNFVPNHQSGLYIPYETRQLEIFKQRGKEYLIVGNNDAPTQVYLLNEISSNFD